MYQNADKLLQLDQICNLLNRALSQTSSSQMICDLTVQRRGILGTQNAMNAVDGATIERRIRINRPDDENTRCRASRVGFSPEISLNPRSRLQHFHRPTP